MANQLLELPDTVGQLTRLRELWLAQNLQISSLPESFYQLTNLRSLNMELCPSMVFPPLQYLEQGARAVRANSLPRTWSIATS
jgi:Leucine-rich repeat (LRR) protein